MAMPRLNCGTAGEREREIGAIAPGKTLSLCCGKEVAGSSQAQGPAAKRWLKSVAPKMTQRFLSREE